MSISDWSRTPGGNDGLGIADEGQLAPTVNDGMRQIMADVRAALEDSAFDWGDSYAYVSPQSFVVAGVDRTAVYYPGRYVRITGTLTGVVEGTVRGASFGTDTTVTVDLSDGAQLANDNDLSVFVGAKSLPGASFPPGTKMVFVGDSAPPGWVIQTDPAYDQAVLHIFTGSPADGGTVAFGSVFADHSHNHTTTIGQTNLNLQVSGHALSQAEMPAHYHHAFHNTPGGSPLADNYASYQWDSSGSYSYQIQGQASAPNVGRTSTRGSGAAHTHGLSGSAGSHSHTATSANHAMDLSVKYVGALICAKA